MRKLLWAATVSLIPVVSSWAASVTVKQSGGGDFTTIQAAINSGASTIMIIDSAHYVENLEIGDPTTGGPAVTLTSNQTGANRPVITPSAVKTYINSRRATGGAGFGVFANNSVIANLINGGVNNYSGTSMSVNNCTFVACVSGVTAGSGSGFATLSVSNSIFHQIGDNVPPSVNVDGITLTNGSPELIGGLYPACTNGLVNFGGSKWSAVFNRLTWNNGAQIIIGNCIVGSIESEDTRTWDDALAANEVTGCRLFAGYDTNFVGAGTVVRATPVFVNTDPDAPNAFRLASGSPGLGMGADLAPVLEPTLSLSRAGNQLAISWSQPLWMKGYALKSTPSLTSPVWSTVPGATNFGVNFSANASIGPVNQFFAILKQ